MLWIVLTIVLGLVCAGLVAVIFFRHKNTRIMSKNIEIEIDERSDGWVAQELQKRKNDPPDAIYAETLERFGGDKE